MFDNSQGKEIYTNHLYSDASLQGYWRLEDNGNDSSPNGYNLTGTAPTLTTTASKKDVFGFRVTGVNTYDGYVVGQNI